MGFLSDTLDFEKSRWTGGGGGLEEIKDNPWRMLGHTGPVGTYLSNKILGRDDEPLHDMWGNATDEQFARAEEQGIDTEASRQGYTLADAIAKMYAGGYGMGQLGGGASAAGGGGYSPSWMDWAKTGLSQFKGGGGEQAPAGQPGSPQGVGLGSESDYGRQTNRLLDQLRSQGGYQSPIETARSELKDQARREAQYAPARYTF